MPTIQIRVSDNHNLLVGNIRRIMADRGLKQYYVAERAGFEKKTFNAMLRGRKIIRAEYIPLIISALGEGVSANDLYRTDKD